MRIRARTCACSSGRLEKNPIVVNIVRCCASFLQLRFSGKAGEQTSKQAGGCKPVTLTCSVPTREKKEEGPRTHASFFSAPFGWPVSLFSSADTNHSQRSPSSTLHSPTPPPNPPPASARTHCPPPPRCCGCRSHHRRKLHGPLPARAPSPSTSTDRSIISKDGGASASFSKRCALRPRFVSVVQQNHLFVLVPVLDTIAYCVCRGGCD
jgi:hypothetical protein